MPRAWSGEQGTGRERNCIALEHPQDKQRNSTERFNLSITESSSLPLLVPPLVLLLATLTPLQTLVRSLLLQLGDRRPLGNQLRTDLHVKTTGCTLCSMYDVLSLAFSQPQRLVKSASRLQYPINRCRKLTSEQQSGVASAVRNWTSRLRCPFPSSQNLGSGEHKRRACLGLGGRTPTVGFIPESGIVEKQLWTMRRMWEVRLGICGEKEGSLLQEPSFLITKGHRYHSTNLWIQMFCT